MTVHLLSVTPDALDILLMTKQTRLDFDPGLLEKIRQMSPEEKQKELDYMRGTIQSSWEFVDYIFLITGVSRAFTHQLVRTRQASYAQQSQRTVDMSGFEFLIPPGLQDGDIEGDEFPHSTSELEFFTVDEKMALEGEITPRQWYEWGMLAIDQAYRMMVQAGTPPQDARGVLPTNIATNIVVKASLRTLSDMAKLRLCTRTQGEYQEVFRELRDVVIRVHPWAEPFIEVHCVHHGVCAFPNYKECPIKGPIFNPETGMRWDEQKVYSREYNEFYPERPATRAEIKQAWENVRFEAVPKHPTKP